MGLNGFDVFGYGAELYIHCWLFCFKL